MNLSALSIKQKLTLSLLVAVISSTLMVGLIGQLSSRNMVSERLQDVELPNILWQIRNQIDKEISLLQNATQQLAQDEFILDWYKAGYPVEQEAKLIRYLNHLQKQYDLTNVSVADRQTARYWNQDGFLRVLQNDKYDGWFFAFRDSGQSSMKSLYTEDGMTKLFVNYQQTNGRMLAGFGRSVNQMVEMLNSFKIAETGFVYLADHEGKIQIHKNRKLLNTDISGLYGSNVSNSLLGKRAFTLNKTEIDGESTYIASSYIESADWYVVAQVPESEVFAELNDNLTQMLLWILVVAVGFTVMAFWSANRVTKPITQLANVFAELGKAEANLDIRLEEQQAEELVALQKGFNAFVSKIQKTVEEVANTSNGLRSEADRVAESAQLFLARGKLQSAHTEEVVVAISQMGESVNEVAGNAHAAADTANELELVSTQGQDVSLKAKFSIGQLSGHVDLVANVVDKLAQHTVAIGGVLEVIRGVSEQTNLLALNAAIEAARAGEMGRGFAVVADEVRALAKRTAESTEEIQRTIDELQKEANKAVALMGESKDQAQQGVDSMAAAEEALVSITRGISQLRGINNQVATATEEQAQVAQNISQNLRRIQRETEESVAASNEVAKASDILQRLSGQLDAQVASYRS